MANVETQGATTNGPARRKRIEASTGALGILAALTAIAALLRFSTLGLQSYWFDESVTVELLRKPFPRMLSALADSESTPPLYHVIAWPWSRIFGDGEVGLRSLSALCGTALVPVAFAVGRALVSARAGLVTAAFVAVSPLLVWYSQEARAYALFALLSGLSVLFFAQALRGDNRRALGWWALVSALALATHYFAVFLVAAEAVWLVAGSRERRRAVTAVAAVAVVGAALLPLAVHQERLGHTNWIHAMSLHFRIDYLLAQFEGGFYPVAHVTLWAVLTLTVVMGGILFVTDAGDRQGALVAFALATATLVVPLGVALVSDPLLGGRGDFFFGRNLLAAWLPLAVALAAVLAARRAGWAGVAAAAAVCGLLIAADVEVLVRPNLQRDDWRGLGRALGPARTDRAVVVEPGYYATTLRLYRPDIRALPTPATRVRELDFVVGPAAGFDAPSVQQPAGFRLIDTRRVQHLTLVRFRATAPRGVDAALQDFEPPPAGWSLLFEARSR